MALPGTSEHHTGLALDIYSTSGNTAELFGKTTQSKWIKDNAWKFGFIVRYPEDKQKLTYIIYEPWYIRYVGYPYSAMLYKENLCYEEFMEYMQKNGTKIFTDNTIKKNYLLIHIDTISELELVYGVKYEVSVAEHSKYILTLIY